MPLLSLQLKHKDALMTEDALVDSGSSLNVLPNRLGLRLGLVWENLRVGPNLTGNADGETRVIALNVHIPDFAQVPLTFAWSANDKVRFLLGQDDFFMKFHVCFLRDKEIFSITHKHGRQDLE